MTGAGSTRWPLAGGIIGPVLFVVAFLVEGAIRPDYDPMKVFVSQLGLGEQGWLQIANFVVAGLLIAACGFALRRVLSSGPASRWGPIMVGLVGLGLIIAGVFVTDPALGYPPGTPSGLTRNPSWHGSIHLLGALLVFGGLPVACFIFARRFRAQGDGSWTIYSVASAVGILVFYFAATASASSPGPLTDVAGLLQRASIVIGFLWLTLLATRLMGQAPATTGVWSRPR